MMQRCEEEDDDDDNIISTGHMRTVSLFGLRKEEEEQALRLHDVDVLSLSIFLSFYTQKSMVPIIMSARQQVCGVSRQLINGLFVLHCRVSHVG